MLVILGVLLLVAIGVIVFLVTKSNGPKAAPVLSTTDDEATRVRMVGHRLVRVAGGVRVGSEYPVVNVVTIGRDKTNTINFNDPELSSQHAEVRIEGDKAILVDKGSTNGTEINEKPVTAGQPHTLKDGDTIKVGATTLLYKASA